MFLLLFCNVFLACLLDRMIMSNRISKPSIIWKRRLTRYVFRRQCISMMLSQNMFQNLTGACYVLVASRCSLSSWCSIFNWGLHEKRYCLSTMVFPQGIREGNGIRFHGSINFNRSS